MIVEPHFQLSQALASILKFAIQLSSSDPIFRVLYPHKSDRHPGKVDKIDASEI